MTQHVVVTCSNGFEERGFASREEAQEWITRFVEAQSRDPGLCDGEHKIKESDDVPQQPGSPMRCEGP